MTYCGTPQEKCMGKTVKTNHGLSSRVSKAHSTAAEAFTCFTSYLIFQGWIRVGNKEFMSPEGGPIRVLPRPGKFGLRLRKGKEGRVEPHRLHGPIY